MQRMETVVAKEMESPLARFLRAEGIEVRSFDLGPMVTMVFHVPGKRAEDIKGKLASAGINGWIFSCGAHEVRKVRPMGTASPLLSLYYLHPDPYYGEVLSHLEHMVTELEAPVPALTPPTPLASAPEMVVA